nr:hypothetical protein CFP56_16927 [Quercus suber]
MTEPHKHLCDRSAVVYAQLFVDRRPTFVALPRPCIQLFELTLTVGQHRDPRRRAGDDLVRFLDRSMIVIGPVAGAAIVGDRGNSAVPHLKKWVVWRAWHRRG